MDLQETISPKSKQLNADDLIGGPITITITKVVPTGNVQQPVAVYFEGDNGRPYLPCMGMRRVMVETWSRDGTQYVGRQMTLYRDPTVLYGGIQVGGIRISHMSHIASDMTIALTVSKSKRIAYLVQRLTAAAPAPGPDPAPGPYSSAVAPPPGDQGAPLRRRAIG